MRWLCLPNLEFLSSTDQGENLRRLFISALRSLWSFNHHPRLLWLSPLWSPLWPGFYPFNGSITILITSLHRMSLLLCKDAGIFSQHINEGSVLWAPWTVTKDKSTSTSYLPKSFSYFYVLPVNLWPLNFIQHRQLLRLVLSWATKQTEPSRSDKSVHTQSKIVIFPTWCNTFRIPFNTYSSKPYSSFRVRAFFSRPNFLIGPWGLLSSAAGHRSLSTEVW